MTSGDSALHAPQRGKRRLGRRVSQLTIGLLLYALSIAVVVHTGLGSMPWDVLSQGIARQLDWSLGTAVLASSVLVLLCWIPLRQRPGFGTLANVLVIGLMVDPFTALLDRLPDEIPLAARGGLLVAGIVLNGLAGALYIGARLGPGPRDGLMTGLVARTGWQVGWVRGGIEVTVVAAGWVLGGTVGVGTVLYAALIGLLLQVLLPRFTVPEVVSSAVSESVPASVSAPVSTPTPTICAETSAPSGGGVPDGAAGRSSS